METHLPQFLEIKGQESIYKWVFFFFVFLDDIKQALIIVDLSIQVPDNLSTTSLFRVASLDILGSIDTVL